MVGLGEMTFGHVGINVTRMEPMVEFYTKLLGFKITDRGHGGGGKGPELVFLSRDPEEHHQIVLASTRPVGVPSTINQISFRVKELSMVRAAYDKAVGAGIEGIEPIDHGNALSVYFPDPEGNRIEVYMSLPWYVSQPHRDPINFDLSDEEVLANNEEKCSRDPSFLPIEEWKAKF
ncbi:MAG: VOC family protein [Pseudomonadota bacterium]|nr:VOC family protein [Pseudomonadota bacterium]